MCNFFLVRYPLNKCQVKYKSEQNVFLSVDLMFLGIFSYIIYKYSLSLGLVENIVF